MTDRPIAARAEADGAMVTIRPRDHAHRPPHTNGMRTIARKSNGHGLPSELFFKLNQQVGRDPIDFEVGLGDNDIEDLDLRSAPRWMGLGRDRMR
jgi:hypothetical protein